MRIAHFTGICKVFASCCNLRTVYLRRCVNLTDDAVAALTRHCSHLEHLNLYGCVKITDASLQLIAHNCKFLQSLNISNTKVEKMILSYRAFIKSRTRGKLTSLKDHFACVVWPSKGSFIKNTSKTFACLWKQSCPPEENVNKTPNLRTFLGLVPRLAQLDYL